MSCSLRFFIFNVLEYTFNDLERIFGVLEHIFNVAEYKNDDREDKIINSSFGNTLLNAETQSFRG